MNCVVCHKLYRLTTEHVDQHTWPHTNRSKLVARADVHANINMREGGERQTDRQTDRQADRQTDRQTDRDRESETETDRQKSRQTDSGRDRQRQQGLRLYRARADRKIYHFM